MSYSTPPIPPPHPNCHPDPSSFQVKGFFKTAFHNFLAYMINLINEDLNLDIVFAQDCNAVLDLFIQLMDLLPKLPKLVEVKAYNNTWPPQQAYATIPSFPFFRRVATAMDKLIDMSVEKMQSTKEPVVERSTVADSGSKCKPQHFEQHYSCLSHNCPAVCWCMLMHFIDWLVPL